MTLTNVALKEILTELHALHIQKATGILYITTDTNKSAQVILDNGEIVFAYYASKVGEEAVELLASTIAGRYRFQSGTFSGRCPLPPTKTILQFLGVDCDAVPQPKVADDVPQQQGLVLGESERSALSGALATYVGPLADIICQDHLEVATSLEEAINLLASEIPSAEHAEEFKNTVHKQLG